jgi:hypothetical protein
MDTADAVTILAQYSQWRLLPLVRLPPSLDAAFL